MSLTKIDSLTAEQERGLVAYREEWLTHGRSVEKADRPVSEAAILKMYDAIGEQAPFVWWSDGPATCSMLRTLLGDNLRDNLRVNLRDNLWANLWVNLRDNLRANLGDNLRANLWDNLGDNLGDNLRNNLDYLFWGQHEAAWSAFYNWPDEFLRPMYNPEERAKLSWWLDLSKSCGWWQPYRGIVFICERPMKQAVDEHGRLHCATGAALECRDGWEVYAWHNVRVNEQIIMRPETLTAEQILKEPNAEVRRVMVERHGLDRFLSGANAKKIHSDQDGRRILHRIEWQGDEPIVAVQVKCPTTGQTYFLRVPPTIDRCDKAVAWTFGYEKVRDYDPLVET